MPLFMVKREYFDLYRFGRKEFESVIESFKFFHAT